MAKKIENCGRCGAQSETLHAFRSGGTRPREYLCDPCFFEAKENRGLTAEQIAAENERWERIYRERFMDPSYYDTRPAVGSSFNAFVNHMEAICDVLR